MKLLSKIFLAFGLLAFVASGADAQGVSRICKMVVNPTTGANNCQDGLPVTLYVPVGFQQISAATLAASTPLTVPAGATVAFVNAEAAGVRWRDDGTAPTATIGVILGAGQQLIYSGNLTAIQFILQSGSPILDVEYYK